MENIILHAGNAHATISPLGAEMTSYVSEDGKERIWEGSPAVWKNHGPILFPVVGSLRDGKARVDGKTYAIEKHGFARRSTFRVEKQGEDFVEMCLASNEETRALYPFDFELYVTHTIWKTGFRTSYVIKNTSSIPLPALIGGHPAFVCPMEAGEEFEEYELVFPKGEDGENSLVDERGLIADKEILHLIDGKRLPLRYEFFDQKDALILTHLVSRQVNLVHKKTGKGLQFSFPDYPVLGVWSKPGMRAPYVCLEPWMGIPDRAEKDVELKDKDYVALISPMQCKRLEYEMELIL